mgnify:CR=1 FL=1
MTHQDNYTFTPDLMNELIDKGFDGLPDLIRIFLNTPMKTEREQYLQAKEYERNENRQGYANGYKPKTVRGWLKWQGMVNC